MALAEKVEVLHDPDITARGSNFRHMVRVEVRLADGTVLEETVEAPRGSELSFASEADVVAKFRKLAGRTLAPSQVERVVELVLGLETVPDAGALVAAMVPAAT